MSLNKKPKVGVIGGGAAGFFFAINLADRCPQCEITILEKSPRFLSKVKVSGGGRCNVTNATFQTKKLVENYPRGELFLKKVFSQFNAQNTVEWFDKKGITLKTEPDNRMFPSTDSSSTIIDCFLEQARLHFMSLRTSMTVHKIEKTRDSFRLSGEGWDEDFDYLFVATGGQPKLESYQWLKDLSLDIVSPLPSLFTFNLPNNPFKGLEGIAVNATLSIEKSKLKETGPLLVTHWGLSGPVVLRLSAWGAKETFERGYEFTAYINFIPLEKQDAIREALLAKKISSKLKTIASNREFDLTSRLWERLVILSDIPNDMKWMDISNQKINKLVECLCHFPIFVKGKTTFKDEFVTCGGVQLSDICAETLECTKVPGLYFGGEVLDIDGITGGFNFQNAWSTAWIAAKALGTKLNKF